MKVNPIKEIVAGIGTILQYIYIKTDSNFEKLNYNR